MKTQFNVDWLEVDRMLAAAGHGQKRGILAQLNQAYGVSKDQVYRFLRRTRGKKKESPKPKSVDRHIAEMVFAIKVEGMRRGDRERELPTAIVLDEMQESGLITAETRPSVATVNRIIRDEMNGREIQPRVLWQVANALDDVQIDFSHSKYYKFEGYDEARQDWILRSSNTELTYKQNEFRLRPILTRAKDKYSGLEIAQCYPGTQESTAILMSFLNFWWGRPEDAHLMRHLPNVLAHDNGAPFKSAEFNSLLEALELNHRSSIAYEKTGIGAIERSWRSHWSVELLWAMKYNRIYLSEYNEMVHSKTIALHEHKHYWKKQSAGTLYQQSILQNRPRMVDVDMLDVACRTYERTVSQLLTVQLGGEMWAVPRHVGSVHTIGKRIRVFKNMRGEMMGELVDSYSESFALTPYEMRMQGDFSGSHARTFRKQVEDELKKGTSIYDTMIKSAISRQETDSDMPKTLVPRAKKQSVKSRFTETAVAESKPAAPDVWFESLFEARVWVGKELARIGVEFSDVASYFVPRMQQSLKKSDVQALLDQFTMVFTKTGTEA